MGLTRKDGVTKASTSTANPAPGSILEALPGVVIRRFPEMEQWQQTNEEKMRQLVEAMDRRCNELENRIAMLERS